MMQVLLTLLLLFLPLGNIETYEEEQFRSAITSNYEYYEKTIIDEKLAVGTISAYVGFVNKDWSISVFFQNAHKVGHHVIFQSSSKNLVLKSDTSDGYFYDLRVEEGELVTIKLIESETETVFKTYEIQVPKNIDTFKKTALKGEGKDKFPASSKASSPKDFLLYLTIGLIALCSLFIVIIVLAYKKRKGVFNPNREKDVIQFDYYQYHDNQDDQNDYEPYSPTQSQTFDANYDVKEEEVEEPKMTKQERMEALFKAQKEGKITEHELNAALRSLWMEDDDD